jgi:glycosyltransferase involved in cell wall biosynthesis
VNATRFCFLMPHLEHYSPVSGGAIATVTANVVAELLVRGHKADVVASECSEPFYDHGDIHPVRVGLSGAVAEIAAHLEARLRGWDAPHGGRFHSESLGILNKLRPEVVVLANDLERITAVRQVLPRARIVVWIHNECRMRKTYPMGLGDADAFLCCSHYIKSWVQREYGLAPNLVHTAHAGIDRNVFYPSKENVRPSELGVLFTGRLDANKGVDIAVKVVGRLRNEGVPIRLSVAGNVWFYRQKGADRDPFRNSLRTAMKAAEVDWLGHVPRRFVPGVMRGHDVAVVPSRSEEPFGLVVLESMASGLAVVASTRGGLPEASGGAAILIDPDDTAEMERWLTTLASNREELQRWKARSIERVISASWSGTAAVLCSAVGVQGTDIEVYESH